MRETATALFNFVMTVAVGGAAGVLGAMLYLHRQEPPPALRVLDMRQVMQTVAKDTSLDEAGRRARTDEIGRALTRIVGEEAARGAIVFDGSAVLRAPARVYVEP